MALCRGDGGGGNDDGRGGWLLTPAITELDYTGYCNSSAGCPQPLYGLARRLDGV